MAVFIFWFSLSVIISIYFGYPLILLLLVCFKKKTHIKKDIEPTATLIIPAYNEENVIRQKIENSLFLDYPKEKLEILLILDGCTDRTKEIAERYVDRGVKIIEQKPRRGKMAGLNLAISQAKGEIIIFTDADIIFDLNAVKYLVEDFGDEGIGCVGGELVYLPDEKSLVETGERLYFRYDKFLRSKESEMQTLLVVSGSIYAMRRNLFEPINEELADDLINPIVVASKGFGVISDSRAKAFGKIPMTTKDEFKQKERMIIQGFRASPQIFRYISCKNYIYIYEFLFHKFFRWLAPIFLILIFISTAFLLNLYVYRIAFYGQLLFYSLALIGYYLQEKHVNTKIFYSPFYFSLVNVASLIGLLKSFGKTIGIWEKAETTRR